MARMFLFLFVLLLGLGFFAAFHGYQEAKRTPVVVQQDIALAGLPAGKSYRILQITDTHASNPDMPTRRLAQIVHEANALKPDLVVLTGDYMGGKFRFFQRRSSRALDGVVATLAGLRAPLGIYLILGNHDSPYWMEKLVRRFPGLHLLVNEAALAGPFRIVGLPSLRQEMKGVPAFMETLPKDSRPTLVLLHEPEQLLWGQGFLARYLAHPNMLVVAGHTHGGQIYVKRLPFLNPAMWHAPCRRGLCRVKGVRIFVSSGVGTSSIPVRLGVPPEMVVLHVKGSDPLPPQALPAG